MKIEKINDSVKYGAENMMYNTVAERCQNNITMKFVENAKMNVERPTYDITIRDIAFGIAGATVAYILPKLIGTDYGSKGVISSAVATIVAGALTYIITKNDRYTYAVMIGGASVTGFRSIPFLLGDAEDTNKDARIKDIVEKSRPDELGVIYLNAGQGNASIVTLPNGKIMVIDCNVDNSPDNIVEFLENANRKNVDYLIVTHPHYDHMSGVEYFATNNFEVGEVWIPMFERQKELESPYSYEKWLKYEMALKKLEDNGAKIKTPYARNAPIIEDGKLQIKVLGPSYNSQCKNEDIHEESMVIQIKFGKTSLLFPGDATHNQLERINNYYDIEDTTVNQSCHHGSRKCLNEEVLKAVNAKYTVISVGKNSHGHPHEEAIEMYKKYTEDEVYRTDHGSIGFRFNSEGENL